MIVATILSSVFEVADIDSILFEHIQVLVHVVWGDGLRSGQYPGVMEGGKTTQGLFARVHQTVVVIVSSQNIVVSVWSAWMIDDWQA